MQSQKFCLLSAVTGIMSKLELDSMATLVESLSKSFIQVPPSAIPAMLDCILLSTGLSPELLFASLSDDFSRLLKVSWLYQVPIP